MSDSRLLDELHAAHAEIERLRALVHMDAAYERAARHHDDPDAALAYEDYMEEDRAGRVASERYHAHREQW